MILRVGGTASACGDGKIQGDGEVLKVIGMWFGRPVGISFKKFWNSGVGERLSIHTTDT